MEFQTIEVPADVARREFLRYRTSLRTERDERRRAEDEQLMRAYREASKGARLIQLTEALKMGGTTEVVGRTRTGREVTEHNVRLPRLAVARADVAKVWTDGIDTQGGVRLDYVRNQWDANRSKQRHWSIARGTFEPRTGWHPLRFVAMAPSIPPAFRPSYHLRNYALLWEAEWGQDPQPPIDPALLKHVGGDLYAVLAVWDLTPLERAVLAGTRA